MAAPPPPHDFVFVCLLVSPVTYGYDDNTPTPLWYFCHKKLGQTNCVGFLPPPPPPPVSYFSERAAPVYSLQIFKRYSNLTLIFINSVSYSPSIMSTDRADVIPVHGSGSRDIQAVGDRSLHHAQFTNSQSESHGAWRQFLPGHVKAGTDVTGTHQKIMQNAYILHHIAPCTSAHAYHTQLIRHGLCLSSFPS